LPHDRPRWINKLGEQCSEKEKRFRIGELRDHPFKIRSITNPDLQYLGILGTKYDRTTLNSKEIFDALNTAAQNAGIKLFNTYIPDTVRFKESPRFKTPLVVQQPNNEGAKAYMTVVEEIING
jgi:chromosome partitioning protein